MKGRLTSRLLHQKSRWELSKIQGGSDRQQIFLPASKQEVIHCSFGIKFCFAAAGPACHTMLCLATPLQIASRPSILLCSMLNSRG